MIFFKWYSLFFLGNLLALRVAGDGGSLLRLTGSRHHPSHSQTLNFNPQNLRSLSIPSLSSSLSPLTRTYLLSIRGGGRRKNICSSSKRKGNQSSTKNKHKEQKASSLLLPKINYHQGSLQISNVHNFVTWNFKYATQFLEHIIFDFEARRLGSY